MCDVDVTIIGGGVVGCATAAATTGLGLSTVLLEQSENLAGATTSRNSEVVHGGMYYPTGSLKADLCVRGRNLLRTFCRKSGIDYHECGKLIVAVAENEIPELDRLLALGQENGVEKLRLVSGRELADLAPEVTAVQGLYSPQTAIINAEETAKAYGRQAVEQGAQVLTSSQVVGLEKKADHWLVSVLGAVSSTRQDWQHKSRFVVNAAGLYSDKVAEMAGLDIDDCGYRLMWIKGNYFGIDPVHASRIDKLIYPVPPADKSSLGVHVCLDLAGQLRLGPDVEKCAQEEYSVDPGRLDACYQGARRFLPWLEKSDLFPAMSGIRPRFSEEGFRDFVIQSETGGFEGLINLIGIDSPGLTSAPAIAEEVARLITLN